MLSKQSILELEQSTNVRRNDLRRTYNRQLPLSAGAKKRKRKKKPLPKKKKKKTTSSSSATPFIGTVLYDLKGLDYHRSYPGKSYSGDVFRYDPPENIWRSNIIRWKLRIRRAATFVESNGWSPVYLDRIQQQREFIDLLDQQYSAGIRPEVTYLGLGNTVELHGGMRVSVNTRYCWFVRKAPFDRTAVRRGDKFTYRYMRQRTHAPIYRRSHGNEIQPLPSAQDLNERKSEKPNDVTVTFLADLTIQSVGLHHLRAVSKKVPPVQVRFPDGTFCWVDWEDLTPLPATQ